MNFSTDQVSLGATLVFGILPGLITSVVIALLFLLIRIARPTVSVLGVTADGKTWAAAAGTPARHCRARQRAATP